LAVTIARTVLARKSPRLAIAGGVLTIVMPNGEADHGLTAVRIAAARHEGISEAAVAGVRELMALARYDA
jgi:hypothetical protein